MKKLMIKKRFVFILFTISMLISLSSCDKYKADNTDVGFPYFTKQQIIDDFDELVDILEKNYPHFSTARRMYGVNKDQVIPQYKERLYAYSDAIKIQDAAKFLLNLLMSSVMLATLCFIMLMIIIKYIVC